MISHLEVELKQLIDENHFNRLQQLFPSYELLKQTNHYFQYEDPQVRIACRVRVLNDTYTLTFKQKHKLGVIESNFTVSSCDETVFSLPEVQQFLHDQQLFGQWRAIGSLETHRHLVLHTHGELCIDRNYYLGYMDYEFEYETTLKQKKEATLEFLKLLEELNIDYQPAPSKFERFLKRL